MRLVVGQVPTQALEVTVISEPGAVDLSTYDSVELVLTSPEGALVSTSGGLGTVIDGAFRYVWPTTSLFATPGDYRLRLKATKGAAVDWSDPAVIEVFREGR